MKKMTILLGVACLFYALPAYADDVYIPTWRGSAGSVTATYDFNDENTFNEGVTSGPDAGDVTAGVIAEFGSEACTSGSRDGVVASEFIRASLTNLATGKEGVIIRFQITSTMDALPFAGLEVTTGTFEDPDFVFCGGGEGDGLTALGTTDHGDGFFTIGTEVLVASGAGCETVQVFMEELPGGTCIDEVIIDVQHSGNPGLTAVATVTPDSVTETEGGTATNMVVSLDAGVGSVSGNVTVTLDPNSAEVSFDGVNTAKVLTFTTLNWETPQTVAVDAFNDTDTEACVETFTFQAVVASTTDTHFTGVAQCPLTVSVIDDDSGCVFVEAADVDLNELASEADTGTLVYTLNRAPGSGSVFVDITDGFEDPNAPFFTADPNFLSFTSGNWNVPQTVTLNAVQDSELRGTEAGSGAPSVSTAVSTVSVSTPGDTFFINLDAETGANLNAPTPVEVNITQDECGAFEFNGVDYDNNCIVDVADFSQFVNEWLTCSEPGC